MQLSQKQIDSIREADARINIWQGAVRSGKSYAALYRFIHFCRFGPPGALLIAGRTHDTLNRNVILPMQDIPIIGKYVKYYVGKREINLFDRTIYVVGANDARAEGKIRGSTFAGAYVDEATLLPESFFKMLLSRLSIRGAKLFATTNPDSPYHWLKKEFLDRERDLDLKSWHFRIDDNPFLDPSYVSQIKREYIGLWYKRFIEGLWVQAEGAIYDFFDEEIHVIDFPPDRADHYIVGCDYGTANPCSFVMVGINRFKYPSMWVEKEYYFDSRKAQRQKQDSEYARDFIDFIQYKNVKAIYIDPSALSFKLELRKQGVGNLYDAENDVLSGIRLVSTYLTEGSLKICHNCFNLIKEFQSYMWDEKSIVKGIDEPKKENDHALDALRYCLYTHFFGKDQGNLSAHDLDRMYIESRGISSDLPPQFQQPNIAIY